jgi:hypothetical protein
VTDRPEHEAAPDQHEHPDEISLDADRHADADEVSHEPAELAPDDAEPPAAGQPPVEDLRIAQALSRLEGLADKAPDEHVEVYEDVHRVLHESLAQAQQQRPGPAEGQSGGATP